jgi:hypothetical protein
MPFEEYSKGFFISITHNLKSETMLAEKQYKYLQSSFTVKNSQLSYDGTLPGCNILEAISRLNDEAILNAFGKLEYSRLAVAYYHIDITGSALVNNKVTLKTKYVLYNADTLEIKVTAYKNIGKDNIEIATGSFIFVLKPPAILPFSLS